MLNLPEVNEFDQSSAYGLGDALPDLKDADVTPPLISSENAILKMLVQTDLIPGTIPKDQVFADSRTCAGWLKPNPSEDAPKALAAQ